MIDKEHIQIMHGGGQTAFLTMCQQFTLARKHAANAIKPRSDHYAMAQFVEDMGTHGGDTTNEVCFQCRVVKVAGRRGRVDACIVQSLSTSSMLTLAHTTHEQEELVRINPLVRTAA